MPISRVTLKPQPQIYETQVNSNNTTTIITIVAVIIITTEIKDVAFRITNIITMGNMDVEVITTTTNNKCRQTSASTINKIHI